MAIRPGTAQMHLSLPPSPNQCGRQALSRPPESPPMASAKPTASLLNHRDASLMEQLCIRKTNINRKLLTQKCHQPQQRMSRTQRLAKPAVTPTSQQYKTVPTLATSALLTPDAPRLWAKSADLEPSARSIPTAPAARSVPEAAKARPAHPRMALSAHWPAMVQQHPRAAS